MKNDINLLKQLKDKADIANDQTDSKVERLIDRLRRIVIETRTASKEGVSAADRRKTIIFSTFADTISDIHSKVNEAINNAKNDDPLSDYKDRLPPPIFGQKDGVDQDQRARVLAGFAPETAGKESNENKYDLLFTTDVLSEGVNLQQASRIINYDLPWNPMRIVQRHGRIDRIGSRHRQVHLDCFFPAAHLDQLLVLEGRLHDKLSRADAAIGVGEVIPGFQGSEGRSFYDTEEQIRRLAEEDTSILLDEGGANALSGEEYRQRLRRSIEFSNLNKEMEELPYGSGSGFVNSNIGTNGYVFCARIDGNDQPTFRFISTNESWEPLKGSDDNFLVSRQILDSLSTADPGSDRTERNLTDDAYQKAFDAWEIAHADIAAEWEALSDPATFAPNIPKALREAANLIADHGEKLGSEQEDLYQRLNSVPPRRVERRIREILNGDHLPDEAVRLIKEIADNENLKSPTPPPNIKEVHPAEIRLVAWMAIQSGK